MTHLLGFLMFGMGLVALGFAIAWTTHRWQRRGGLKVPLFQDRFYRNTMFVAGSILTIGLLGVVTINVVLLVSPTAGASVFATNLVLFVAASVIVSLAEVEGRYGTGLYLRKGASLVKAVGENLSTAQPLGLVLTPEMILVSEFWDRISEARFEELQEFFHQDARISLPNTRQAFEGPAPFIAFNKAYPGRWRATIVRRLQEKETVVTITRVSSQDEAASFFATSYFEFREGKVQTLEEYWSENGSPPDWRKDGLFRKGADHETENKT